MQLANYIGLALKSEAVIELLEDYEMKVIYDFDRLQEGTADSYSAAAPQAGFELGFNEQQLLETIWCNVQPHPGFDAVELGRVGAPGFDTFAQAAEHARQHGLRTSQAQSGQGWIRFEYDALWVHYEFNHDLLDRMTFMSPR
jgi:hypothetical protein